jgi:alpha-2-macroglobulin
MLRLQIITAALVAVCFASCMKGKNEVSISSRNFENEIEQQQNLVFTFDRELVPDSLVGMWDTVSYARITPPVRGQFKWNSKKELMFSPYTGFRPSTDYKAELTHAVVSRSGKQYFLPEERTYSFHTPYLKLISASGFWALSEKNKGAAALKVSLIFNYKVDPGTLSRLLHVSLNSERKEFIVNTAEVSETITAVIEGIDRENLVNIPLKVTVDKGLKCIDSDYLTKENLELVSVIPSPDKLEITQAAGEYDANEAVVHVFATQAVDENKIAQLISTDPKVKFSVEMASDGFYLKGGFTAGLSYQLTVSRQLRGVLGGEMEKDFSQLVVFGALEPSISFVSKKGIYLSSQGAKNIAVNIISVPRVRVTIKKVYENNIVHFIRSNRYHSYEDYYYDDEEDEGGYYGYRYNNYSTENYSDIVFDQWYDTKNLPKLNGVSLLNLSLEEEKKYKGIYLVDVSSSNDLYRHDTKLVSISDIGLITKRTENEMYVFVNSIKTAEPMRGVEISFISTNNQSVFTATTNGDGVAEFVNMKSKAPRFNIAMVTAKQYGDFNYLMLDDSRVSNSRFDVGGRRTNSIGYMAFLYGDRNIYRPGETIYLNTIVRDEQWSPIGEVPVKIKMLLPNGKEYKTVKGTLDKQGAFATSFPLPAATVTGTYVAEVYSANDVLLQSRDISVEEFMPDRISVNLKLSKEDFSSNDTVIASVNAMNLFGPPATDRKYEVEYSLTYKYFSPKNFKGYNFSISRGNDVKFPNDLREGKTDEQGNAEEKFKVDTAYKNIGVLEGKIFATVFDETGRPVNRVNRFDVFTQDVFYGIKMTDYYVHAGENFVIPLMAVDKNGKAMSNSKAQIQVIRHDWYSIIERTEGGGYRWVSRQNDRVMLDQEISLGKDGYILNYKPRESGNFEVRIMPVGGKNYVSGNFYSYGWGYTNNTSFAVNTEGEVDITFDKEKYNVGDDATILFTAPFNGKLLVTVECDRLLESFYLETDKKTASVKIPVKENYLPNVYLTATLFRPLDDGAIPMTVAHGFAPMIVNKESNSLPITIIAAEQSRSKMKQKITVKTKPIENVELTIAVVDEGILQLKNYKTPDPYAFFYQKKALEVTAYDLYATILPDLKLKRSTPGGDGYDLEKRVNPLTNKRVKLVAFWSGQLQTNSAGEASYTIDIPQFSGDLRIMVCAYKDRAFGSADKHM